MKTWFIRPLVVVVALQRVTLALAAPPGIAPSGASSAAVRQVEARRKVLSQFELVNLDRLGPNERAAMPGKMGPALTE